MLAARAAVVERALRIHAERYPRLAPAAKTRFIVHPLPLCDGYIYLSAVMMSTGNDVKKRKDYKADVRHDREGSFQPSHGVDDANIAYIGSVCQ